MKAEVQLTQCICHPETCDHGSYSLWLEGSCVTDGSYDRMKRISDAINKSNQSKSQRPDVGVSVTEEMVERALNAQPFTERNSSARIWQLVLDERDAKQIVRAALTAALRTGGGA